MSLIKQVKSFCTSNTKQTVKAMAMTVACVDAMLNDGNTDPLSVLITRTDPKMQRQVRAIVGKVVGGYKFRTDKSHWTGIKWSKGDNAGPTELMPKLRELVDNGNGIYDKAVKEALFPTPEKDDEPMSIEDFEKAMVAYAKRKGFTTKLINIQRIEEEANDGMPIAA